ADVEFAEIPSTSTDPLGIGVREGPEYSAFNSWIPGGTIESFEWKRAGSSQFGLPDERTFVLLPPPPVVSEGFSERHVPGLAGAFQPMCLRIRGTRLSSSG